MQLADNQESSNAISLNVYTVTLKILINQLLSDVLEPAQFRMVQQSSALSTAASQITNVYNAGGIKANLTSQEISDGLQDCSEALAILDNPDADLPISASLEADLHSTLTSIQSDLNNAMVP